MAWRKPPRRAATPRVEDRRNARERGYTWAWQKARAAYLATHPLCRHCQAKGLTTAAAVVDHVTPHRGDMELFWDPDNWQPLCTTCHGRKTAAGQ